MHKSEIQEIIRELIQKEIDEASMTGAIDGGAGPPKTPLAFSGGRKSDKKKKKKNATNSNRYVVVNPEDLNEEISDTLPSFDDANFYLDGSIVECTNIEIDLSEYVLNNDQVQVGFYTGYSGFYIDDFIMNGGGIPYLNEEHYGIITILSNDPSGDVEIPMIGRGITPPNLVVIPDSLFFDLNSGDDITQIIKLFTVGPRNILNLIDIEKIETGNNANLTIINSNKSWVFDESSIYSKSKNSIALGKQLTGRIELTISGKNAFGYF